MKTSLVIVCCANKIFKDGEMKKLVSTWLETVLRSFSSLRSCPPRLWKRPGSLARDSSSLHFFHNCWRTVYMSNMSLKTGIHKHHISFSIDIIITALHPRVGYGLLQKSSALAVSFYVWLSLPPLGPNFRYPIICPHVQPVAPTESCNVPILSTTKMYFVFQYTKSR